MSSSLSPRHQKWWSRPPQSGLLNGAKQDKDLRRTISERPSSRDTSRKSSTLKFNTLVSAIGFRSNKKHPSLAIQDPPSDVKPVSIPSLKDSFLDPPSPARPKALSFVSPIRSLKDVSSLPSLHSQPHSVALRRGSMTALPDASLFSGKDSAAESIPDQRLILLPSLSSPTGALSIELPRNSPPFSPSTKSTEDDSTLQNRTNVPQSPNRSDGSSERPPILDEDCSESSSEVPDRRPGSLTTLTEANLFTGPIPSRYSIGFKGPAEGGGGSPRSPSSPFNPSQSSNSPSGLSSPVSRHLSCDQGRSDRPLLVVRQASLQHILPPSTPPTHQLPPPPLPLPLSDDLRTDALPDPSPPDDRSSNTSVVSMVSTPNTSVQNGSPYDKQAGNEWGQKGLAQFNKNERTANPPVVSSKIHTYTNSTGHSLRKASSHHAIFQHSLSTSPHASLGSPRVEGMAQLRKQHSFHHTSSYKSSPSAPPMPLRHANSFSPIPASTSKQRPTSPLAFEQKNGSLIDHRTRLISGSSLRSLTGTRPSSPEEEDGEDFISLFSLPIESEHLQRDAFDDASMQSSRWDEASVVIPDHIPPAPPSEYVPQRILSPEQVLGIEASALAGRVPEGIGRARGMSTASTTVTESTLSLCSGGSDSASSSTPNTERDGRAHSGRHTSRKSSTENGSTGSNTPSSKTRSIRSSRTFVMPPTGLPPPPRPPPRKPITIFDDPVDAHIPPFNKDTSCSSTKRFIIKKPSFLEIEDEVERPEISTKRSFLDFRESFDTIRSADVLQLTP